MTIGRINQVCTSRHQERAQAQCAHARTGEVQQIQPSKPTVVRTRPPLFDFRAHESTLEAERSHTLESMHRRLGLPSSARVVRYLIQSSTKASESLKLHIRTSRQLTTQKPFASTLSTRSKRQPRHLECGLTQGSVEPRPGGADPTDLPHTSTVDTDIGLQA